MSRCRVASLLVSVSLSDFFAGGRFFVAFTIAASPRRQRLLLQLAELHVQAHLPRADERNSAARGRKCALTRGQRDGQRAERPEGNSCKDGCAPDKRAQHRGWPFRAGDERWVLARAPLAPKQRVRV